MNFTRDADMKTKPRALLSSPVHRRALVLQPRRLAAPADDALIGLWSYETSFGSSLHGEIDRRPPPRQWRAVVGNVETEFKPEGDRIQFAFPGDGGRFRGTLNDQGIDGFWIRPAATKDPRFPGGSSQAFATPLKLSLTGQHTFIGVLRPLANPFTLYLRVFRAEDGALMAAFRNPEQHSHGPAMQYRVAQDGDAVHFTAGSDPAKPDYRLEAKFLSATQRIRIDWPDAGGEIELVRRTSAGSGEFLPAAARQRALRLSRAARQRGRVGNRARGRPRPRRSGDHAHGAVDHRRRPGRAPAFADPFHARRLPRQAGARRVFLRLRARPAARPAFCRQDLLVRPARRRDQGWREDRARHEDLRRHVGQGPVRQPRSAQVARSRSRIS